MGRDCASERRSIALAVANHRPGRGPRWGRINAACCSRESPPVFVAAERAAFDCLTSARIAGFDSPMGMVMLSRAEKLTSRAANSPRRSPVSAAEPSGRPRRAYHGECRDCAD